MTSRNAIDTEYRTAGENVRSFAISLCVGFTAIMLVSMVMGSIFASEEAKQGINLCWSIFGVCVAAAALQLVFFTPTIIRRMPNALRSALFGLCLYAVLAVTAVAMGWFPSHNLMAWVSFTITYLLIFAVLSVIFSLSYKRQQRELDEKLAEYRRKDA